MKILFRIHICYPHFKGVSQKCTQGTPPVKARNSQKVQMLKRKIAWNSIRQACTWQTAVGYEFAKDDLM